MRHKGDQQTPTMKFEFNENGIIYLRFPDGEGFHIHYSKIQKMLRRHIFKATKA